MKKWKQVLAVIGTAALLMGNLASVSQPVFADADSDGTKTEAVSSNVEGDGSSDNEAEQESAADENAASSSAEDSGENSSDNSTEDAGAAADDAQSANEQTSSDNAGAEDQKSEDQGTDSDAKSDDEMQNADQKEEASDQNDQENAQNSNSGAAVTDEDAEASDSAATQAESAATLTTEDTAVTADTEAVTVDGEEAMPARTFDPIETDNFVVKISIGEGTFKEDVNPLVVELSDEQAMEVAEKASADDEDTTVKAAAGVDVTFTDEFGQKTQPAEDGKVDITLERKTPLLPDEEASSDDIDYQIVHEHEDEIADTQTEDVDANGGSISVDSLSPIVLAAMQKSPAANGNGPITIEGVPGSFDNIDAAIDAATPNNYKIKIDESATKDQLTINKAFDKDVTFTGKGTISMDVYGWYYNHTLKLDGDGLNFNVTSDGSAFKAHEDQRWLMLCLGGKIDVKNGASMDFTFDSNDGVYCAIYSQGNSGEEIRVEGDKEKGLTSKFSIHGKNTKGKSGQGIQLDKTANSGIFVTGGSEFLIDGTNRGYVNSPVIYVEDSTFTVQNCSANASNGGKFTAANNSTVLFKNNAGHGLSANDTTISDSSTLTSEGNGYTGIDIQGKLTVTDSTVNVRGNGWHTWGDDLFAGLRLREDASFDSSSTIDVKDNYEVGIHVKSDGKSAGNVKFNGSKLTVVNNGKPDVSSFSNDYYSWDLSDRAGQMQNTNGGGIWNQGVLALPERAEIHNNHAKNAGDDIYSTGTVTLVQAVSSKSLNGGENNKARADETGEVTGKDCTHEIDGWYDDSEKNRWDAHQAEKLHIEEVEAKQYQKAKNALAVKAAHGISYDPIKPSVPEDWSHSKSKTATNLNKNYDSTVTLAVPSSEVPISSDVVFVLDKSTSADVKEPLKNALQSLQQQIKGTDATVKVGVVVFNKVANVTLPLTELKEENQSAIDSAIDTKLRSGTNLHAGILAGTKMLDEDTTVAADHKYLVVVSDGITYMYGEEPTSIISEQYADGGLNVSYHVGNDNWKIKYGDSSVPSDTKEWNQYLGTVQAEVEADGDKYDLPYDDAVTQAKNKTFDDAKVIYASDRSTHAMCVDKALYKSYEAYENARSEGYHTFALIADTNKNNMSLYPWGPSFIKYLNNEKEIDFKQIMKEIYYVVDQGSSIEDFIGSGTDDKGNSYDFSFVNDLEKIDLTLGGQKLDKEKITDNTYGFGKDSTPAAGYKFVLTYNPDQDAFKVDINVPITLKDTLQISYDVHLTNPQEKAGTYGQYDQDGSKGYQALYTNNEAVLHPVDSNGYQLKDEYFPKPTVSYTVDEKGEITPEPEPEPMPEPEPESTPSHHNNGGGDDHGDNEGYGTVRLYKVDAQTGAKLSGAVFSLYKSDGEFVGSYTTDGDGAITVSSIPYSTYYFKETKAPDGYTLDPTYVRFYLKTSEMNLKFSNTAATVPTVMVGGTKTWVDNDNAAGMRPSSITLHLFANGVEVGTTQASADTNWTYSFGAQPVNGIDGKPIAYTMTEDTADSYTSAISNPVASNDQIVINVTNTYQGVMTAERGNGTGAGSAGHAGVATGDNSQMAMYGILFLIAGAGFAGMLVRRKFN